jgi:hypothetical protein
MIVRGAGRLVRALWRYAGTRGKMRVPQGLGHRTVGPCRGELSFSFEEAVLVASALAFALPISADEGSWLVGEVRWRGGKCKWRRKETGEAEETEVFVCVCVLCVVWCVGVCGCCECCVCGLMCVLCAWVVFMFVLCVLLVRVQTVFLLPFPRLVASKGLECRVGQDVADFFQNFSCYVFWAVFACQEGEF